MTLQEVIRFVSACLEASVYIAPTDYGLTFDELLEAGSRKRLKAGEIQDSLQRAATQYFGSSRITPGDNTLSRLQMLLRENPEYKNPEAFRFLYAQLREKARTEGAAKASIERQIIVERAVNAGIPRNDIEVAITLSLLADHAKDDNGQIRIVREGAHFMIDPSSQAPIVRRADLEEAYPIVKDVMARRTDGRPKQAEPFDAFSGVIGKLGYPAFTLWWALTVAELKVCDPSLSPLSALVLSAAIVEGSLTFVVKHARSLNIGVMGSTDLGREPRNWKIDYLVDGAARGGSEAIVNDVARANAKRLIATRQRIHAGGMLSDYPAGIPDLRPEEVRAGIQTAEQVVRAVLDWLERHPPT